MTTTSNYDEKDPKSLQKLLGRARFEKEATEIGCLLMLVGLPEIIQPLTWIAGLINGGEDASGNPVTVTEGLKFSTLFGYLCCVLIGVMATLVGYAAAFHRTFARDASQKWITVFVSVFVQTAYILTVSTCMNVTRVARDGKTFEVPAGSLAAFENQPNARLLAAMGVLAIIAYWFGMLGSISVLLGALTKFQEGKPEERDGNYYKGRLFFYSFVLFLGGFAQLVAGAHLESVFDLKGGPIPNHSFYKVAMLVISYPSMSITVGLVQMINGIWGMLRKVGIVSSEDGGAFICSIWFGWFVQLVLQIMVQPSIIPGDTIARAPPELAAFAFGMNFMPAYLDSKTNNLPAVIDREYYGCDSLEQASETKEDEENSPALEGVRVERAFEDESSLRYDNVQDC